ncbi:uncharacterized protein LOC115626033 [Scaptodrosophila lebanonensis]|uniref:Uncharacterized protein LOC115626033 n=1 Tax=Drosophila lebanonensis TaxID=7225 RepID=A0A6J2TM66_DROLE|nr:uncharacterized protein LOC115626033 [Scaptodrosophila lebanonensis]
MSALLRSLVRQTALLVLWLCLARQLRTEALELQLHEQQLQQQLEQQYLLQQQQLQHQQHQQQLHNYQRRHTTTTTTRRPLRRTGGLAVPMRGIYPPKCWREVPAVFFQYDKDVKIVGNSTINPGFNVIEVCCKGWQRYEYDWSRCVPDCGDKCHEHGFCLPGGRCQCFDEFVLNHRNVCVPTCPLGCPHGQCYLNGTCVCQRGYELDGSRKFCQPQCNQTCGHNEVCDAPGKCVCAEGYARGLRDSTALGCQPICIPDCGYGHCVGPNQCECFPGYEKRINGTSCQSACYMRCENGFCANSTTCVCQNGYRYDMNTTTCLPDCGEDCENGVCISPGICRCFNGYVRNGPKCEAVCERGCGFYGKCIAPNLCGCALLPGRFDSYQRCEQGFCSAKGRCRCMEGKTRFIDKCLSPDTVTTYASMNPPRANSSLIHEFDLLLGRYFILGGTQLPSYYWWQNCAIVGVTIAPLVVLLLLLPSASPIPQFWKLNALNERALFELETRSSMSSGICYKEVMYVCKIFPQPHEPSSILLSRGNTMDPELRLRIISYCCEGYVRNADASSMKCEPTCSEECSNGICTAPDVCECYPGTERRGGRSRFPGTALSAVCPSSIRSGTALLEFNNNKILSAPDIIWRRARSMRSSFKPIWLLPLALALMALCGNTTAQYKTAGIKTRQPPSGNLQLHAAGNASEEGQLYHGYASYTPAETYQGGNHDGAALYGHYVQPSLPRGTPAPQVFDPTAEFINKTREAMASGVCFKEVPTASLVHSSADKFVGNGTSPDMSRIQVCCEGYERNPHVYRRCEPICADDCPNGICTAPNTCVCMPGHVRNHEGKCISTCPLGCGNGVCDDENECRCRAGYKLDPSSRQYCRPDCQPGCAHGQCVAPNKCACLEGYRLTASGTCEPKCDNCENGGCTAPGHCSCNTGYLKVSGVCEPICTKPCENGRCIAPDTCECTSGFDYDQRTAKCTPHCDLPCLNGVCEGQNRCACNAGYIQDEHQRNICQPHCPQGCPNGFCSAPNFCICKPGFIKSGIKGRQTCLPV